MEFKDLTNITNKPRENSTDLYNIDLLSFEFKPNILFRNGIKYIVSKDEEMRMDMICFNIYGNTDYVDFLMDLNNIKNPLAVYDGMEILYVPNDIVPAFRPELSDNTEIRNKISNKRKRSKPDPNRKTYLEEKSKSLPPTVTKRDYNPVKYRDGKIRIGDDIFKI